MRPSPDSGLDHDIDLAPDHDEVLHLIASHEDELAPGLDDAVSTTPSRLSRARMNP